MRGWSSVAAAAALASALAAASVARAEGDDDELEPHRGHDDTSAAVPGHERADDIARRLDAIADRSPTGRRWRQQAEGGGWVDNSPRGKAHRALVARDYDGSLRWLEEALTKEPGEARILLEIATVLAARGDLDGAAAQYRKYLARQPDDLEAQLWLAQTLSWSKERRHRDEAEALLTAFLAANPGRHDALLARARTRSWNGDVRGAVADFDTYMDRHPERRDAVELELAVALAASKELPDLTRALAIYDARLATKKDLALLLQRARIASWAGFAERADADYNVYLGQRPYEHGVILERGRALSWSKDPALRKRALPLLDAYLQAHPDDLEGVLARARARSWAGDGPGSVVDYRAYLRARPDEADVRLELGRALAESRVPAEAREGIGILREALKRRRDDDALRLTLARALIDGPDDAGRPEGIALLREYLKRHADDEVAWLLLARALSGAKNPEALAESLRIYDAYLERHPGDDDLRLQRARVRAWARRNDDAEADYRIYLARHPGSHGVLLELARTLAESSAPERSLPVFAEYASRHPDDYRGRLARARAMRWSREFDDAEDELDALRPLARAQLERDDRDVERVRLWAETGRKYEAFELAGAVLRRSPNHAEARAEYERLYLTLRSPSVTLQQFFYFDKSEISISSTTLSTRIPLRTSFGVLGDVSAWSLGNAVERIFAARANVGGFYRWRRIEVGGSAGPRFYERFAPQAGVNAYALVSPTGWSNLTGTWHYDDLYFDLLQPASVSSGVRGHALALTGDANYERWGLRGVGRVGGRWVRPENRAFEASATITVRVKGPLTVGYSTQYIAWDSYDPSYWSPQAFAAHLGVVRVAQTFSRPDFTYEVQGLLGVAGERVLQQPEAGFGFAVGLSGVAVWRPVPWVELRASAQFSQTIRQVPDVAGPGGTAAAGETTVRESQYWWFLPNASVTVRF